MKKVGFIGAYDKTDCVLYIAKILVELGHRVLFIDATITQKARYIVPNIQTTKAYITNFEGIDVGVGMKSFEEVTEYLNLPQGSDLPYDIVLIDTNSAGGVISYKLDDCEKMYFATSMDMYAIRKGIESLSVIKNQVNITKILFSRYANKEEIEYLDYLSSGTNIVWNNQVIYYPFELGDQTVIEKNQRVSKIKLMGLSPQYKEGLMLTVGDILEQNNYKEISKVFKKIEKGV